MSTAQVVLTVDAVIYRGGPQGLEVLLIQRAKNPYQGYWSLPGGKVDESDPTLEYALCREVWEEATLHVGVQCQLGTYGDTNRDPRGRYVSVACLAYPLHPSGSPVAGSDAAQVAWFPVSCLPPLAFDHAQILQDAMLTLAVREGV